MPFSQKSWCSSSVLDVLQSRIRLRAILNENEQTVYRSNRHELRITNIQTILSRNSYTAWIERNRLWRRNLNRGFLHQFLTKSQTTNCYIIYKHYSTITTMKFAKWWWANFKPSWWQWWIPSVLSFEWRKQMQEIDSGDAWNGSFSSTMLGSLRINNCHWRTTSPQLRIGQCFASISINRSSISPAGSQSTAKNAPRFTRYGWTAQKSCEELEQKWENVREFSLIFC